MPGPDKPLPQRLLDLEHPDPGRRARYEQAVRDMLEPKLAGVRKWSFLASAVGGVGIAAWFVVLILATPGLPFLAQLGLAGGVAFSLGWAVMAFRLLKKGTMNLKNDPVRFAGLVWVAMVMMETLFMLLAVDRPGEPAATLIVVSGLVFLLGAGVQLVRSLIEQAEARTREKLLEIEYRLTQVAEELARRQ